MREKVGSVMQYSNLRMIYTHTIMEFRHFFTKFRKSDNYN
ncbi:MAG: nitrous oxide-stimulated promoter family protein [Promethearchaeota archaeon]